MLSKKRLALMFLSGLLVIGLLAGGATYALFTSSASNTGNTFAAGTVILTQDRDMGDAIPGPMFYTALSDPTGKLPYDTNKNYPDQPPGGECIGGMAPGDQITRAMNIYNDGTLDARIKKLQAAVNAGFGSETSSPAYDEFIDKLNVLVKYPSGNKILYDGKLSGLLSGWVDIDPVLASAGGGALNLTFTVTLDKSAGNAIQGKNFVFDFSFQAEQKKNNP
jgi:predicted ribosomally synthesized peptide with SipW-like signal peptide